MENFRIKNYLFYPERLTDIESWHGLIPFAFYLMESHHPKIFVELGTHKGDSYCAFCQAVEEFKLSCTCYAVDNWQGDSHSKIYSSDIFADLNRYNNLKYINFSRLIKSNFADAVKTFDNCSIDLLHIDGFHTYDAVKNDFETWSSKLSDRSIVLFHDIYVTNKDFGVKKYWDELKLTYPTFELDFSNGLGVLAYGEIAKEHPCFNFLPFEKEYFSQLFYLAAINLYNLKKYHQLCNDNEIKFANLVLEHQNHISKLSNENYLYKRNFDELEASKAYQIFTNLINFKNDFLNRFALANKLYKKIKTVIFK